MRISRYLKTTAIFLLLAIYSCPIHADLDMEILPGFDGFHKNGSWLPLRITLSGAGETISGEIVVEIQDSKAGTKQIYSAPTTILKSTGKTQYLYVLPESFRRNLQVSLIDNSGNERLRKDTALEALAPEDTLVVAVSNTRGGLEFTSDTGEPDAAPGKLRVVYSSAENLPDKWKGYGSVDVIILGDISARTLSAGQEQAITDWVYSGGRLIVSGGAHSQNFMGTFIENLLPVKISGTRILDSISSLSEQFGRNIVVAASELANGGTAVAAEEDGLPVIAERQAGDGKVIFLAFDYLDPAFRAWDGRKIMWKSLLPQPAIVDQAKPDGIAFLLSVIETARGFSYKFIGIFLSIYILCFGPLNYLILRKYDRGELMWLTMPAIAAVFIIGSLSISYARKERGTIVKDISVVNVYQDTQRARIDSYFGLFPQSKSDYRISFRNSETMFANRMLLKSSRMPQDGDCRLVQKDKFHIEVRGIKSLSAQFFHAEAYVPSGSDVSITLNKGSDGITKGEVFSDLPFDLADCYVVSGEHSAYIGDLVSGNRAQFNLSRTHSYNIVDFYPQKGEENRNLINLMKTSIPSRTPDKGLVGWVEKSILETLVDVDLDMDYKAQGKALVIVHL